MSLGLLEGGRVPLLKVGTLILTSLLEDLGGVAPFLTPVWWLVTPCHSQWRRPGADLVLLACVNMNKVEQFCVCVSGVWVCVLRLPFRLKSRTKRNAAWGVLVF